METKEIDKFRAQSMAVFRQLLADEKYGSAQALALGLRSLVPGLLEQFQEQYTFKAHANGISLVCVDNFERNSVYIGKDKIRLAYTGAPLVNFVLDHPEGDTMDRLTEFLPLVYHINYQPDVEEFERSYTENPEECMDHELQETPFISQSFEINGADLTHIIKEMDGEEL